MSRELALIESEIQAAEQYENPILYEAQKTEYDLMIDKIRSKNISLSFSFLKEFLKSPKHAVEYKLKVWKQTEEMIKGELCHMLMLEEHLVNSTYVIIDKFPSTDNQIRFCEDVLSGIEPEEAYKANYKTGNFTKIYGELQNYIEAMNSGKKCISLSLYETCKEVTDYLKTQPKVMSILNRITETEKKVVFNYQGWDLIGFIDGLGKGIKIDLKFLSDAEPSKVERSIVNDKYYMQAGIYDDAHKEEVLNTRYFIIACDYKKNYSIIEIDRSFIEYGKREYKYAIAKLEECIKDNRFDESYNFFDHKSTVRTIFKPKWIKGFETDNDDL